MYDSDITEVASGFLVGAGILTMALFPLAIPIVALLIVAALPLVVIGVAIAIVGAVLAAPVLLARAAWRRLARIEGREGRKRERPAIRGSRAVMGAH